MQGDQKVSVHLTITVQSSGAQRLFDHPVQYASKVVGFNIQVQFKIGITSKPLG